MVRLDLPRALSHGGTRQRAPTVATRSANLCPPPQWVTGESTFFAPIWKREWRGDAAHGAPCPFCFYERKIVHSRNSVDLSRLFQLCASGGCASNRHSPYVDGPLLARCLAVHRSDRLRPYVRPVCALAHERWPRWFPRREFQTDGRPHRGPLGNAEFLSSWID